MDSEQMEAPIFLIPGEVLAFIMSFLTIRERLLAERTCHWFRNVSKYYWSSVKDIQIMRCPEGFEDRNLELLLSRGSWSLQNLALTSRHLTDRSLHAIAQNCENLQELFLCNGNFTDVGLEALAEGVHHLQYFNFRSSGQIHDEGLSQIFHGCKKLQFVYVGDVGADINGKCLEALGPDVTDLYLEYCTKLKDGAIEKMLHSCGKIVCLSLGCCSRLTDVSLSAIGQCTRITELTIIDLPHVTKIGLKYLCHLKNLQSLTVRDIPSMDDDILVLISKECHQLRELDTSGTKVTDIGICSIAVRCPLLSNLEASHMEKVSDLSLKIIATHSENIESVIIESCPSVTDEGVVDIITQCPKLSFLILENCQNVGDASLAAAIIRAEKNPSKLLLELTGTSVDPSKFPENSANLTIIYDDN